MKRYVLAILALLFVVSGAVAHNPKAWRKMKGGVCVFMTSDIGREGSYDQQVVAELMGEMAGKLKPKCIVTTGDNHHGNGVRNVKDNDWMQNFTSIYTHPKLAKISWYPAIGNHEYRGNTQALIDFSSVDSRWDMPNRYYTKVVEGKGTTIRFVIIDTTPLINRYRESNKYPDAALQDKEQQLEWLDDVLSKAKEDWVIVAGHHPIHADTKKSKQERTDMRNTVDKILRKHSNVAMYVCGHIHNFQHLRDKKSHIDYIVNTSGAMSRTSVRETKRTKYCSGETGFSVLTATKSELKLHMIDKNGNILNTVKRHK